MSTTSTPRTNDSRPRKARALAVAVVTSIIVTVAGSGVASAAIKRDVPDETASQAVPVIVADPRDGDLRIDAEADVLPVDYEPSSAGSVHRDVAYGPAEAQKLDLYLPDRSAAPVIVFLHAGGWVEGDRTGVPAMVLRFVERGYAVASVEYHLAPDHVFPTQLHDVKLAIRWVKAYGAAWGAVDGDRVVLYGVSAGGHLATLAAATPGQMEPEHVPEHLAPFDTTVAGVVAAVGPADLERFYRHDHGWAAPLTEAFLGCDPCAAAELAAASPMSYLHDDLPPAYFAYGTTDELVDAESQGRAIATAWAANSGPSSAWLDLVDEQGHNLDGSLVNQRAVESFVDFVSLTKAKKA